MSVGGEWILEGSLLKSLEDQCTALLNICLSGIVYGEPSDFTFGQHVLHSWDSCCACADIFGRHVLHPCDHGFPRVVCAVVFELSEDLVWS